MTVALGKKAETSESAAQKTAAEKASGTAAVTDPKVAAQIAQLRSTDAAVRAHEAAHIMVGGTYVRSAASYTYQTGPDGKQYAVGGEVSIDTSPVPGNPQATIDKMMTVRAAALAPSDPSAADRAVAAAAVQMAAAARAELNQQNAKSAAGSARAPGAIETPGATKESKPAGGTGGGQDRSAEAAQFTAQQVQATYGAFSGKQTRAEPAFQVAA